MFMLIEPKDYCYYKSQVDFLMELINLQQDIPLSYAEKACSTFIIGEGRYTYGGAILFQQHINDLPNKIRNVVSSFSPRRDYVWAGTLSLCIENKLLSSIVSRNSLFYKNLFKKLIEFGNKKDIDFLYLTLNPHEYHSTKNKGFRSYILEVNPQDSLDGLFHVILPLSGNKDKILTYIRSSSDYSSQYRNCAV